MGEGFGCAAGPRPSRAATSAAKRRSSTSTGTADHHRRSISRGVKNVVIMDGRVPHSILMELLTDEGAGTRFSGAAPKYDDRQSGWE